MQKKCKKIVSMTLALCFVFTSAVSVQAAGSSRSSSRGGTSGWGSDWGSSWLGQLLDSFWRGDIDFGYGDEEPETEENVPETEEPVEKDTETVKPDTGSGDTSDEPGMDLELVEDQSTVSDAVVMRAAKYAAAPTDAAAVTELGENNVVYYKSTLIDYDETAINQSMADLEVQYALDHDIAVSDITLMGLYFGEGNGAPSNREKTGRNVTYYNDVEQYIRATVTYSSLGNSSIIGKETDYYYLDESDGTYYPVTVNITRTWGRYTYELKANNVTIHDSGTITDINKNVDCNLYTHIAPGNVTVTLSKYAPWIKWGLDDTGTYGGYIHSGMISGLVDGVPQFTGSYASRLFDSSAVNGKTYYSNVGLPFMYNSETNYYTYDSSYNGTYFPGGVASSNVNLEYLDAPMVLQGYKQVNGSWKQAYNTSFMPFNQPNATAQSTTVTMTDGTEETKNAYRISGTSNHYFSMIASVPFTMTETGTVSPSDPTPIAFEFSGDDDVWVFIDDVLVLDLGGIHDAVSGKIDFAANDVTFWTCASGMAAGDATEGGYGISDGAPISQGKIFNDEDGAGKLNTTRSTFAATDNHTLTIVYVERGANLSNNKIKFNLPQKDYIAVTKQIDENLYQNTDESTVVEPITDALFATLNQRDFSYILYENNIAMAGAHFSRYDASGNFIGNGTTASDGTFTVKNGQTVRFYDIDFDGKNSYGKNSYYVEELDPDAGSDNNAWGNASWAHTINTAYAGSSDVISSENAFISDSIATEGSTEAVDVIYFTNTNKLLSPVADIVNDEFVLDFGLAVELNPLANDTYSATNDVSLTLIGISDTEDGDYGVNVTGQFGTLNIINDKLVYTLHSQFTDAETLYYRVGLRTEQNGEPDELEGIVGKITIMPASTMYYEESFPGLNLTLQKSVKQYDEAKKKDVWVWSAGTWDNIGTAQGGYQEEGRVGTTTDSPYGSDVIYSNNTGDSYGTSKYVNTAEGGANFTYTFTGTGTALYARTSDKSAYMAITVKDTKGNKIYTWNRNTIYKPVDDTQLTDNTLYNIPVFTYMAEQYGTYTVDVSLAKSAAIKGDEDELNLVRGYEFHLDGIRVYNPANAFTGENTDSDITIIEDAYRKDGEAYITVESLRNKLLLDSTKYVPVVDEDGNPVVDEDGDPIYDIDIDWEGKNFVVFTDSNGEIKDAQTYQSAGPKEEVYMKAGQSVAFSLADWDQNHYKIYLGIKAPAGSGEVSINGNKIDINNTTDIYYDIKEYADISGGTATFRITAESALISVTTIKVTGDAEFTIVNGTVE